MRKLFDVNVNYNRVGWIHSYLTLRPQYVTLKGTISDCIVSNTGAPQECVLFTLYTNDIYFYLFLFDFDLFIYYYFLLKLIN